MKRITAIIATALCFIFLTSCEKEAVDEWHRFWGFTNQDIAGHYDANPDESIYKPLPTAGIVVYSNASMEVTALAGKGVSIQINIPSVINRTFSGTVYTSEGNSDIVIENGNYDIRMTVYKNDTGGVRFHGRVQQFYINADNERTNLHTYGFDVLK